MANKVCTFKIEVSDPAAVNAIAASAELMDMDSLEYIDFEESIQMIFASRGFELDKMKNSDNAHSRTRYFTYAKITEDNKLQAFVQLRVSDHFSPDRKDYQGNIVPEWKVRNNHVYNLARDKAKELDYHGKYIARSINIVFNGTIYRTYESALKGIEKRLDSFIYD